MKKHIHFPELSKTRIWSFNNMYASDKNSNDRHSCDKKTCDKQTCENTHCPGNTEKVCCA
jgi:hypothetical protein